MVNDPIFPLLEAIVKNLVDTPGKLEITTDENNDRIVYIIRTASGEQGQVIGKSGQLCDHIRGILRSVAQRHGTKKIYVEVDPKGI